MLSDCLSPHVDACQIERGPEFIDRVIREVAIEGLVGFRLAWETLEGDDWIFEQRVCNSTSLSFIKPFSMCACKDK